MSETRRATVMLIQRGDPEIAGALMAGIIAGRAEAARGTTSSDPTLRVGPPVHGPAGPVSLETAHCAVSRAFDAPEGEGFGETVESVEIVTVEQDKWRRVARQVRVAVGNNKTAEDYRLMIVKARCEYAVHRRTGPAHTAARKLLLAWVMLCQGIRRAYREQDRILRP